jgi:coiled-coil domain-containing protein 12
MEDAAARKARLKRLREEADATEAVQAAAEEPKLKFRNYAPRDEKIEHDAVPQPDVKEFEPPEIELEQADDQEDLLINVAPKKPNWDLRRDIAKKLEKLERRTQKAMIQIMKDQERQRLEAEGGQQD